MICEEPSGARNWQNLLVNFLHMMIAQQDRHRELKLLSLECLAMKIVNILKTFF
jgi:hypothetical protein